MSLLTLRPEPSPRTPRERIYGRADQYFDVTNPNARTEGSRFLPTPVSLEPTPNFSVEDQLMWDHRLADKGSKMILKAQKRFWIREFLKGADIPKDDKELKQWYSNTKSEAHRDFELQDNQVYRKKYHNARKGEVLPARYALCYNDSFEVLTTIHERLMHACKYSP